MTAAELLGILAGFFDVRAFVVAGIIFIPLGRLLALHRAQPTLRRG